MSIPLNRGKKDRKFLGTAKGFMSLSFQCGVEIVSSVEVTHYVITTCNRSHKSDSSNKVGREYGLQPELLKTEISY